MVRRVHRKVHEMRHGPSLEDMGGTKIDSQSALPMFFVKGTSLTAVFRQKTKTSKPSSSFNISRTRYEISYEAERRNEHVVEISAYGQNALKYTRVYGGVTTVLLEDGMYLALSWYPRRPNE